MLISGHIRFYTIFAPFKIILVHMRRINQQQGWGTLRKRLGTPTSRICFMSPVIVRLINWTATYDGVFIVLVMIVAKAILLFSITPFYHMLCDVVSIFAVRTFVVSQAFTMVLTLIDNS